MDRLVVLLPLEVWLFLPHPLQRSLFVKVELKLFNALQLFFQLLLVTLRIRIFCKFALDPFVEFLVDQVYPIDAIKLIDGYNETFVNQLLNDFDLHFLVLPVDFFDEVIDGVEVSHVVDPADEGLASFHHFVDLLIQKSKILLVHHVEGYFDHYFLNQATVESLQASVCLFDVQKLLNVLFDGLLDGVVEYFGVCFVFCEQFVVLLDLLGMQSPFGFDQVKEYLLDLQVVLLDKGWGTKDRFM